MILIVASFVFLKERNGIKRNIFILNKNIKEKRLDRKGYAGLTLCSKREFFLYSFLPASLISGPEEGFERKEQKKGQKKQSTKDKTKCHQC